MGVLRPPLRSANPVAAAGIDHGIHRPLQDNEFPSACDARFGACGVPGAGHRLTVDQRDVGAAGPVRARVFAAVQIVGQHPDRLGFLRCLVLPMVDAPCSGVVFMMCGEVSGRLCPHEALRAAPVMNLHPRCQGAGEVGKVLGNRPDAADSNTHGLAVRRDHIPDGRGAPRRNTGPAGPRSAGSVPNSARCYPGALGGCRWPESGSLRRSLLPRSAKPPAIRGRSARRWRSEYRCPAGAMEEPGGHPAKGRLHDEHAPIGVS